MKFPCWSVRCFNNIYTCLGIISTYSFALSSIFIYSIDIPITPITIFVNERRYSVCTCSLRTFYKFAGGIIIIIPVSIFNIRRLAICSLRDFAAVALCFISFYETALSIISLIIPKIPIAFITISSIRDVR